MWLHSSDWWFSKSFVRSQPQIKIVVWALSKPLCRTQAVQGGRGKQKVSIKEDLDEES
jgi:hypothetical protein